MNHTTFKLNTRSCLQYVVAIDIMHSYSRSVVYQAMTSIIQEVVTMVTANENYSLLKSTYIRLHCLQTKNLADPRIYEYTIHPTSIGVFALVHFVVLYI